MTAIIPVELIFICNDKNENKQKKKTQKWAVNRVIYDEKSTAKVLVVQLCCQLSVVSIISPVFIPSKRIILFNEFENW